ncbi:SpiroCoCo family coiled-coil protein, partial [Treponema saccharophilum]
MGAFTAVIVVVISAVFSIVIVAISKIVDKDGNSMDKVRRYSDKRIREFEDFFESSSDKLNALSADVETHQAAAGAAVKRLDRLTEEFDNQSKTFEEKFRQVDDIRKKLDSYGNVLSELMQMTENAETNLKRVRAESAALEKISGKISALEKSASSIENRLPKISEEFTKKNNESLKTIGTELLNQYQKRADNLDLSTKDAAKQCAELLDKINSDIQNAYSSASERASHLEEEVFKRLQEEANSRTQNYLSKVEMSAQELEKQLAEKIGAAQQAIDAKTDDIAQSVSERTATLEELLRGKTDDFTNAFDAKLSALEEAMQRSIT